MFGLSTIAIRWLAGAMFVASVVFGLYYKGRLDERKLFNAYKAEVKAAALAQEEVTRRAIATQQQITKKAEERHAKDISTLRVVYDRMRKPSSGSAVPFIPDTARDPAQATAYYLDVAPELAVQCGETTQQVISLQDWINEQSTTMKGN